LSSFKLAPEHVSFRLTPIVHVVAIGAPAFAVEDVRATTNVFNVGWLHNRHVGDVARVSGGIAVLPCLRWTELSARYVADLPALIRWFGHRHPVLSTRRNHACRHTTLAQPIEGNHVSAAACADRAGIQLKPGSTPGYALGKTRSSVGRTPRRRAGL
jgi:hypothetical protein